MPARMPITTDSPMMDDSTVEELTIEQGRALFDRECRIRLGVTAEDFLTAYDAGTLDPNWPPEQISAVEILLPFTRPTTDADPLEQAALNLALAEDAVRTDPTDDYPTEPEEQRGYDLAVAGEVTMWATLSAAQSLLVIARHLTEETKP